MKKAIISALFAAFSSSLFAQPSFPLSEYLKRHPYDLLKQGFRYDPASNTFTKSKSSGSTFGDALLRVYSDTPSVSDFSISVQWGDTLLSRLNYRFYNDDEYVVIMNYIKSKGIEYTETDFTDGATVSYWIEGFEFTLKRELQTGTTHYYADNTRMEKLYNIYRYTINTGVKPDSKWQRDTHLNKRAKIKKISPKGNPYLKTAPAILYDSIVNTKWARNYDSGTIDAMSISERLEFMDSSLLRYTWRNNTTGHKVDIILSFVIDENVIIGTYKEHADGSVDEKTNFQTEIHILPHGELAMFINNNYSNVKILERE